MNLSKEKLKSSIESLHDYGVCPETRTCEIFGMIDSDMKRRVIANLHLLDQTEGTITILLSTGGGSVPDGLAIIDQIKKCKNFVRIYAIEEVASMGSVIFQAGDERIMYPNSYLMLHEGEAGHIANKANKKAYERMQKWHDDKCIDIYLGKIKQKKKKYNKSLLERKLRTDWILFPEEAVEWGLCDDVIDYDWNL